MSSLLVLNGVRGTLEGQQPGYSENRCGQSYSDIFQIAQIAGLTVARQKAHRKLSFGINFIDAKQRAARGDLFKQCHSDNRSHSDNAIQTLRKSSFL